MEALALRSKLFVPASRPELFAKALAGAADALSFDLEDAVVEARKAEARAALAQFLASPPAIASDKTIIVRTNAPSSLQFADDVRALALPGVDLLNLPKIEKPGEVLVAVAAIERAEAGNGVGAPIGLLITIETPEALANAAAIARAHPRVAGLQLGLADLFEPYGIDRRAPDAVHAAMFALRMAAARAGVFALDAAFSDIADAAGFSAEAARARQLGFAGKSCIHPSQVALANAAFAPTAEEIERARRILAAWEAADAAQQGAILVDGRMIDLPFVQRARAVVAASVMQERAT